MCLVVPLKTIKKKDGGWVMEDGRVVKKVLTEKIEKGDYLICQQDVGVEKLSKKDAEAMRQAIKGVVDELRERN
jgi:hydrogenase maturation factor